MKFNLLLLTVLLCVTSSVLVAQKHTLSGVVTDEETKEPLFGANIWLGKTGAVTDFDGRYSVELEDGTYEAQISYVGYEKQVTSVTIAGSNVTLNAAMKGSQMLKEVMITADMARARETPVAFSNIAPVQLQEELAAQELPMVLNSTPGAYATQSGGGDGDARITIRGFNQRNVAVMIDGIPVNDMENGWVYWSNWFGLDLVTQRMQIQRGLGASKLSIPSVGGTINILTKGIDSDKSLRVKQEVGNNGFFRTTLGYTSGRLKGGWGISAAASYKEGEGWVDGNFTKGAFYYLRLDKKLGEHLISLSGFGAPQEHGQRPFRTEIAFIDSDFARELGVPNDAIVGGNGQSGLTYTDKGLRANQHWGLRDGEVFNTRQNYYHKPQFNLRHSWQASEKTFWSNIAYLSIGNGGGTAVGGSREGAQSLQRLDNGQFDIEGAIAANQLITPFRPEPVSEHILRSGINNHFWYGFLSTLSVNVNENLSLSGGIDGRYYRGDHHREVRDLLGGDYFNYTHQGATQVNFDEPLVVGDKFVYDYSGFVRWAGAFGQAELKNDRWSAFVNVSAAMSGYKAEDFMKPKVVELADTSFFVAYNDPVPVVYNDVTYTVDSPEAENQIVDWINLNSFTFKMGASRKFGARSNVFFNTGYLSKAQRFNNVINTNIFGEDLRVFNDYENEKTVAFELGYGYRSPNFTINVNAYHTVWQNKPLESPPTVVIPNADGEIDEDSERIPVNISGIDAVHQGIEADFAIRPSKKITFEGLISIGDWRWNSSETAEIYYDNQLIRTFQFDAIGVHVGDAAQVQLGGLIKYEPIKGGYLKLRGIYFDKNYADFQPEDLQGEFGGRESWQLPSYMLFNFHTGYNFNINKMRCGVRFNVLNLFDNQYISDARNNDRFNDGTSNTDFDAKSASVHFGQGRRWTASFGVNF